MTERNTAGKTRPRLSSDGAARQRGPRLQESKPKQSKISRIVTIIAAVAVVVAGGVYHLTGRDPLGLFEPDVAPPVAWGTPGPAPALPTTSSGGSHSPSEDWWDVLFTDPQINTRTGDAFDPQGTIPEALIGLIAEAQTSIHVAAFEFNLTSVAEALLAAHERGVKIQWVTDDEHGLEADKEEGHGQFAMLESAGVDVRDDGRSALMHNKFWIFDGHTVWTGSTNITHNGTLRNNNNVIVLRSPQVAAIFEREFQEMWDGQFGPRSPSTAEAQKLTIDQSEIQILFAAEDEAVAHLRTIVDGAQESIRVMAFSFTHDVLGEAMLDRARAGIDVKGLFEKRGSETEYSELTLLACAKVPARQDGNPRTLHHKVIVVDGETLVTGSLNFSRNADDSNDENVVIVRNRAIAARYLEEFERRWAEGQDPNPDDLDCGWWSRKTGKLDLQ